MEFHRHSPKACVDLYRDKENEIESLKRVLFPGDGTLAHLDDKDIEHIRPSHVYDELDGQREQELADDLAEGVTDDPRFANLNYGNEFAKGEGSGGKYEEPKYRTVNIPNPEEMAFQTRRLAAEQKELLAEAVHYCKEVRKAEHSPQERAKPIRKIVHGGAGT